MMPKKPKVVHQIEISKISGIDLKKKCKDKKFKKNDQMFRIVKKPN